MTTEPMAGKHSISPAVRQAAHAALEHQVNARVGARLITLMDIDPVTGEGFRFYSNMPDVYPLAGRKKLPPGVWVDTVITNQRIFVASTIEEIAEVFADHQLIGSLGCGSVINIPLTVGPQVFGTLNCLDAPGAYTPAKVTAVEGLQDIGLICLLLEHYNRRMEANNA